MDFVAYTLQPVNTLPADYVSAHGGTMYFGMSQSPLVDANATAVSLWRLTNTASLDTATPDLSLSETSVETGEYTLGVHALQQDGPTPFLHCANRRTCIGESDPHQFGPLPVDSGSGKVYGAWLHDGVVYLTTTTALEGPGGAEFYNHGAKWRPIDMHDGVAWVALRPSTTSDHVTNVNQGIVDVPGENLLFPSLGINADGEGAIGVTPRRAGPLPDRGLHPVHDVGPDLQRGDRRGGCRPERRVHRHGARRLPDALGRLRRGRGLAQRHGVVRERVHRAAVHVRGVPGRRDVWRDAGVAGELVDAGERLQPELRPPR